MSKLKMMSSDLTAENIKKIGELFPSVITEVKAEDGSITHAIDFDLLKQELSVSLVEGPVERYQLDWPGKRESLLAANAPIAKTLRPVPEESVDFDTTENLFIEGDNLEALKLLQESYLGKVKMIYIDPPYNTGNDFVYNDDFAEDAEAYLERSLQKDENGDRLVSNTESNGRFHSDWLSMMHSRLRLARNLLTDDGVIFISIDDNELFSLKVLCDEIFGENNFLSDIVVEITKTQGMKVRAAQNGSIVKNHEHVLIYSKSLIQYPVKKLLYDANDGFDTHYSYYIDENLKLESLVDHLIKSKVKKEFEKLGLITNNKISIKNIGKGIENSDGIKNYIYKEISNKIFQDTACDINIPEETINNLKTNEAVIFNRYLLRITSTGNVRQLVSLDKSLNYSDEYFSTYGRVTIRGDLWKGFYSDMMNVAKEGNIDFKNGKKPLRLLRHLMKWVGSKNDIVLDFFAGSSTTAHAVMQLNAEDGGNRKFIMVQLPEATDEKSEAYKAGYQTIAEISKERIRRAGKQILESENIHEDWNRDIGFRVFKVDSSNMKEVYYHPAELSQADLLEQVDNVKADRTPEDLLFQVMLDWGLELSLPIATEEIEGKKVFFVDGDALIACFDAGITESLVQTLAAKEPLRLLFRDNHYLDNDTKINAEQLVKQIAPNTELKSI